MVIILLGKLYILFNISLDSKVKIFKFSNFIISKFLLKKLSKYKSKKYIKKINKVNKINLFKKIFKEKLNISLEANEIT